MRVHRNAVVSLADVERVERGDGSNHRLHLRGVVDPITVSRAHGTALETALRTATDF